MSSTDHIKREGAILGSLTVLTLLAYLATLVVTVTL